MASFERNCIVRFWIVLWVVGLGWLLPSLAFAQLAAAAASGGPRTLTLITGDQLLIGADGKSMTLRPRAGRDDIYFDTRHEYSEDDRKEHVYVIPSDAAPLIAADKLDRELFDITELLNWHYDDESRKSLPIIVTYDRTRVRSLAAGSAFAAKSAAVARTTVTHRLISVNGEAFAAPKQSIGELWNMVAARGLDGKTALAATAAPIRKIWLNGLSRPLLDRSVVQIGAPTVWALGFTGTGVTVAVIDTGVDNSHPDLVGQIIDERNFVPQQETDVADHVGHGTHVASIIAGTGAASGGRFRGVAPDARIISGKACFLNVDGGGSCDEAATIAAMEWAVIDKGVRIVNMSMGGPDKPGIDPTEEAINRLTAQYGALFVVSAGNDGGSTTVNTPASADAALSVAAVDRNDLRASFSSGGPRRFDFGLKPEISAPGVGIVAARAKGTGLGAPVDATYTASSGTSMAAPHVAGVAALLKQLHPEWNAAQLKPVLMGSAHFTPTTRVVEEGAGRVDVPAAFAASVLAEPASVGLGLARFPHNQVMTRTVNYRNLGTADVTLTLTVEATGPDGSASPAGMFSVSPATLVIPAGGSAAATLTFDDRVAAPSGFHAGRLIANANGQTVVTPLSVQREEEKYDVRIRHINFDGKPSRVYNTVLTPLSEGEGVSLASQPGAPDEVTVRLRPGRYRVESAIKDNLNFNVVQKTQATFFKTFDVSAESSSLILDARTASPVTLRKPADTAQTITTTFGFDYTQNGRARVRSETFFLTSLRQPDTLYFDSGTEPQPELTSWISRHWVETTRPTMPRTDPSYYAATFVDHGTLPTGPERVIPVADAAVVDASYASVNPELNTGLLAIGGVVSFVQTAAGESIRAAFPQSISLPGHRRELYYTNEEQSVSWSGALDLFDLRPEFATTIGKFVSPLRRFHARAHYRTDWNQPVYGPALPTGADPLAPVRASRNDLLSIFTFLHSDRAGNLGSVGDDDPSGEGHHYRLYRNGQQIVDTVGGPGLLSEPVSPEAASYRFEAEGVQTMYGLSSRVTAAWEFQSAHVESDTVLPLMTVRLFPYLNESGQAERGEAFALPFVVTRVKPTAQEATACRADRELGAMVTDLEPPLEGWPCPDDISSATLDVSYDDGASWTAVPVRRFGRLWIAAPVDHPQTAEFVSLRSAASDRSGNRVEQTVIRAYGLIDPTAAARP